MEDWKIYSVKDKVRVLSSIPQYPIEGIVVCKEYINDKGVEVLLKNSEGQEVSHYIPLKLDKFFNFVNVGDKVRVSLVGSFYNHAGIVEENFQCEYIRKTEDI